MRAPVAGGKAIVALTVERALPLQRPKNSEAIGAQTVDGIGRLPADHRLAQSLARQADREEARLDRPSTRGPALRPEIDPVAALGRGHRVNGVRRLEEKLFVRGRLAAGGVEKADGPLLKQQG